MIENFYNEARVSIDRYSRHSVCYQVVLVTVSNLTYKLVTVGCAGFATVFSKGFKYTTSFPILI